MGHALAGVVIRERSKLPDCWMHSSLFSDRGDAQCCSKGADMKCSLNSVAALIATAIASLSAAIALANLWVAAAPLFGAAALVATVSFVLIPAIKNALRAYASCRGPSESCTISLGINNLGQAAA